MRLPDAADDPLAGVRNKGAAVLMPDADAVFPVCTLFTSILMTD